MDLDREALPTYRRPLMFYGLGAMMVLAGVSKFIILDQWIGYTPTWAVAMVPVGASTLMHAASVLEIVAGLGLLAGWRTRLWASIVAFWLAGITVMTAVAGYYDVAIRDLGLTIFAVVVVLETYDEEA